MTYEAIIKRYIEACRSSLRERLRSFRKERSLGAAVLRAARAQDSGGKRLRHQRRLERHKLTQAARLLSALTPQFRRASSFEEILSLVESAAGHVWMRAELYVYDVALHIGAHRGLYPGHVYLHAGTRRGARALGLGRGKRFVTVAELPNVFHVLKPHELEDLLCIFNVPLAKAANLAKTPTEKPRLRAATQ